MTCVTDYVFLILVTCVINHAFFYLVTGVIDYAFLLGDAGRFYRSLFSSRLTALACDSTRVNSFL